VTPLNICQSKLSAAEAALHMRMNTVHAADCQSTDVHASLYSKHACNGGEARNNTDNTGDALYL
jgi:hypothetical protein